MISKTFIVLALSPLVAAADFTALEYRNPGLAVELKAGFASSLRLEDVNGDGRCDFVVSSKGVNDWYGSWFFENTGGVFRKPVKIGDPFPWPDRPKALAKLPVNVHVNYSELNYWQLKDYDGDGLDDALIGLSDRKSNYGWDNAWTTGGVWTNGPVHGLVFWMKNLGPAAAPKWDTARPVMLESELPLETYGNACPMLEDFDGDGDLDFIVTDFMGHFTYFENIAARTAPVYTSGRLLHTSDGKLLRTYSIPFGVSRDWDGDGHVDIVATDTASYVSLIRHTGRVRNAMPVFEPPKRFLQEADKLGFGCSTMCMGFDWDGDGDWDIVSGDEAGYVMFFENLSGPGVEFPKWAAPRPVEADGKPIYITGGYNGSVQGPGELNMGYPTPYIADWDGDGLPDLLLSVITGDIIWYRNTGTRKAPKLEGARDIVVEWDGAQPELKWGWYKPRHKKNPKGLLTQWRVTPCAYDWNRDGLVDLVAVDSEGYLAFFERGKDSEGRLVLKAPKRIFLGDKGTPLHPTSIAGGGRTGRIKHCICDWDGDGRDDFMITGGKNAFFYRQLEVRGDGLFRFASPVQLGEKQLERHNPQPTVVDFDGDGRPDFILNDEAGYFYYLRNPQSKN